MKRAMLLSFVVMATPHAYAATDHYLRRDGGHVQHLKITTIGEEINAAIDVDFEPNPEEAARGIKPCSVDVEGEAKKIGEKSILLKKQIPGEAHYCSVEIALEGDGAKTKQSEECRYFLANFCKFDSEGKSLLKIK
jgi:hypothetical protein